MKNNTLLNAENTATTAVLRALCATGCVGVGGVEASDLRVGLEGIDRAAVRAALADLAAAGHAVGTALPWGTLWAATPAGAQSVGHRGW